MSILVQPITESEQIADFKLEPGQHRLITSNPIKILINVDFTAEKYDHLEKLNVRSDKLRKLGNDVVQTGKAVKATLMTLSSSFEDSDVQPFCEGMFFGSWTYKSEKYPDIDVESENHKGIFEKTKKICEIQNFSRFLQETPSNLMTPVIFAETIQKKVQEWKLEDVIEVKVRDTEWIKNQKMGAFLGVAQGSIIENPPIFLEVHLNKKSGEVPELCFVGKGITFDAGGISIKLDQPSMVSMKSDMGGAAVTMSTILGAARLGLTEKYVCCLTPLTDNMPDGRSMKLGDVLTASNGKTIEIHNTDAEGRLVLADALVYADKVLKSKAIVDVATLTGSMVVSLSDAAVGMVSRNSDLASKICASGFETGERIFELPFYRCYTERMKKSDVADLRNLSGVSGAGALTAAGFLSEFVEIDNWAHLDIAGVFKNNGGCEYMKNGSMTGKPVRSLMKFVECYLN